MSKYHYCPICGAEQDEGVGRHGILSCDECDNKTSFIN